MVILSKFFVVTKLIQFRRQSTFHFYIIYFYLYVFMRVECVCVRACAHVRAYVSQSTFGSQRTTETVVSLFQHVSTEGSISNSQCCSKYLHLLSSLTSLLELVIFHNNVISNIWMLLFSTDVFLLAIFPLNLVGKIIHFWKHHW